jgi:hypothetical protein
MEKNLKCQINLLVAKRRKLRHFKTSYYQCDTYYNGSGSLSLEVKDPSGSELSLYYVKGQCDGQTVRHSCFINVFLSAPRRFQNII